MKWDLRNTLTVKNVTLSLQHALAMFGGTILIPMLMGLPPTLGLFCAGIGTLIYHFITKNMIPIFLGSSAAYLAAFVMIKDSTNIATALGSFVGASITYLIVGLIVMAIGYKKVMKILPPTVAGAIIIVIGITLVPVALMLAGSNLLLALISALAMVIFCSINKGIFKVIPVLLAMTTGYVVAIFMGIVDFTPVLTAPWFALPALSRPEFHWGAIQVMAIIALVSMLEHIGELTTNGMIVGRNHFENPGLHRSFFAESISLLIAGLFGGTPTTTYGENTGVIAITKNSNPNLINGAAVIAILLSLIGKFGALLATIPLPVVGGVSFMLFGMITMAGITTLKESKVNLMDFRNAATVFVPVFIGVASLIPNNPLMIVVNPTLTLSGLSLAAIVGILLNLLFTIVEKFTTPKECSCEHCNCQEAEEKEQLQAEREILINVTKKIDEETKQNVVDAFSKILEEKGKDNGHH